MGLFKNSKLFQNTKSVFNVTFLQSVKDRKERRAAAREVYEEEDWTEISYDRKTLDADDRGERQEYVKNCLEQMADAAKELENLNFEYRMVTSYLRDMEEIEALPEEEQQELKASAEKIEKLEKERGVYLQKKNRMSDEKFHQVDRMAEEADEACRKLTDAEEYRDRIKQDMSRLEGEKHAYLYRKNELKGVINDTRGMTAVCSMALIVCFVVLLILQYAMDMDTQMGFLLAACVAVLMVTVLYLKYTAAIKEMKRVDKGINRIIMLQNRVKIRYVNNTNLLDYLYLKYQVSSAREMGTLWEKYKEEKEERRKYREAELELDDCQLELLTILKCYQIKDPAVWLHQTAAILDSKEMVEIRHNLIIRRQSLRRRIDYNKDMVIGKMQAEIKSLAERYPRYAGEIMGMVSEYEKDLLPGNGLS